MAKLVFPRVAAPYRGFVGEVRGWMNRIATWSDRVDATGKALMVQQLLPLAVKLGGYIFTLGAVSIRDYLGVAYNPVRTGTLQADGTIRLFSTDLPLRSGTKVLMPAATGSYTNGYTFTIVNGAITAVVAS